MTHFELPRSTDSLRPREMAPTSAAEPGEPPRSSSGPCGHQGLEGDEGFRRVLGNYWKWNASEFNEELVWKNYGEPIIINDDQ